MGLPQSSTYPRGPERKLTPEQEAELVRMYHGKEMRPKALRERFDICKATLYNVIARSSANIEAPPADTGRG